MEKLVHVEIERGIATVTIDNPPMNVLSVQVTKELGEAFTGIAEDPNVIAVILTGAGNRAFMAGADIKEFPQWVDMSDDEFKTLNMESHRVLNLIDEIPKPTIAMLNGMALGGGCELALTCDIRIAEEHVQIGLPEVKLGLFPGGGGTQRLPRLIGEAKAKELMFSGDPISAEEARQIGLVNQVAPTGEGMGAARSLAEKMAGYSLQALSRIKQAVNEGMEKSFEQAIDHESDLFVDVFNTEDVREGVSAFIEKRTPNFKHQ
ncbi:enoyl-CoA hydratase [Desertibacillus haloalkaliphilus]|uniref:enoyl-CoA hydratase n=1 Tax=Desertibacillus haloalkaliphilus TaxID=1328930 RepID=UPI001C25A257|nr:enoyl-CoA hydratase [Desertibacillus haloalkaliphilus]MBU8906223.1 enoyl-CoA hydratase [Desertibacillus haloalkaliphilus]